MSQLVCVLMWKLRTTPAPPKISEHLAKLFFQNLEAVKIETKFNDQQNAEHQYFIRNSMKTYPKWKLLMILRSNSKYAFDFFFFPKATV